MVEKRGITLQRQEMYYFGGSKLMKRFDGLPRIYRRQRKMTGRWYHALVIENGQVGK